MNEEILYCITKSVSRTRPRCSWTAANKSSQDKEAPKKTQFVPTGSEASSFTGFISPGKVNHGRTPSTAQGKQSGSAINTDSVARGESIFNDARPRSQQSPQAGATGSEQKNGVSFFRLRTGS
jgi:hypothetical protein